MEKELNKELFRLRNKQSELDKEKEILNIKANKENYYLEKGKYIKYECISKIKPYIDNNNIMSVCNEGTYLSIGYNEEKTDNLSNKMLNEFCTIVNSVNKLDEIEDRIEVVFCEKYKFHFIAIFWTKNKFSVEKWGMYENFVDEYLIKHNISFQ